MPAQDFDPEILQDFLTESGELLDELEGDLVRLEEDPADPDMLNKVFRALHTIKGSASFLALTNLVAIAHAAESALNAARGGSVRVDRAVMDMLLAAVDVLKEQMGQLAAGQELVAADPELVRGLAAVGEGIAPPGGEPVPAGVERAPEPAAEAARPAAAAPPPAETAPPAAPCPSADDAPGEAPMNLGGAQAELFEPFVADVEQTLASIGEHLARLGDAAAAKAAQENASDLAGELATTVEFFEFRAMSRLVAALRVGLTGLGAFDAPTDVLLLPRLEAVHQLLLRQAEGLASKRLRVFPDGLLIARVEALAAGETEGIPPAADAEAALAADGVATGTPAGPEPAAEEIAPAPEATAVEAVERASELVAELAAQAAPPPAPPSAPSPTPHPASHPASGPAAAAAASAEHDDPKGERRGGAAAPEQTIRVEVGRLESLMNLVGELVLQKNRMSALARSLASVETVNQDLAEAFALAAGNLDRVTGDMQVAVMRTRMQPLEKLFGKYPRLIRDLAAKTGKKIRLVVEGGETEVDKSVIEELGDPLVHLMRNSADHGLEPPEERLAAGKDECGTITLRATHEGSHVRLIVADDGRGLSRERIGRKAVEKGLTTPEQLAQMSDREVYRFVMAAGFSTAEQVSDLSGRGVGMDVVRANIENIKGTIDLASDPGRGTTITITIPLTVAIMPAMMVAIGPEVYAVPLGSIVEIVRPEADRSSTIGGSPVIRLRDRVLPLLSGSAMFGVPPERRGEEPLAVVLQAGEQTVGLLVSRVIGQQEIVIKPLDGVEAQGPVSGATVRDDGGVSLIVDVGEVIRSSR